MTLSVEFAIKFNEFLTCCKAVRVAHMAAQHPILLETTRYELEAEEGQRYVRIVACEYPLNKPDAEATSRSAWAFVCKKTGDVLKPATWRAPAKHARGNIYAEDGGMGCIGPYGPAYLR